MGFPPLGNFGDVVGSVSIAFPINTNQDALFHHIAMAVVMLIGMVFVII